MKTGKRILSLLLSLMLVLGALATGGTVAGATGSGTSENPYQISTYAELKDFANRVNNGGERSAWAVLTADITATDENWTPINNYNGTFDGQGHRITGLSTPENYSDSCAGFFARINESGTVKNVGLEGGRITGGASVGGVAGSNSGTVKNCYNTGSVSGLIAGAEVGGVAGDNYGTITNCFNTGNLSASSNVSDVAGVAGGNYNGGTVTNCYNAGSFSGAGDYFGLFSINHFGTVENCYYDAEKCSCREAVNGPEGSVVVNVRGLTTAEMTGAAAAENMTGFDFASVWAVKENDYPVLKWQITEETGGNNGAVGVTPQLRINEETNFWEVSYDNGATWTSLGVKATGENGADGQNGNDGADGVGISTIVIDENGHLIVTLTDGTVTDLGQITTAGGNSGSNTTVPDGYIGISTYAELKDFANRVNNGETGVCAVLTADITATDENWTPIGNEEYLYTGTFDGQGHKITGLSTPEGYSGNCAGFFGCVSSGTVRNVGLEGGRITGNSDVGGVAGYNHGTVENCYNTGSVSGLFYNARTGGVVGTNLGGTVANCCNTGDVSVSMDNACAAGVAGGNYDGGTVTNCCNTGNISCSGVNTSAAGVVGSNHEGTVTNCYNAGSFSGAGGYFGLVYINHFGTVENCYYDTEKSYCWEAVGGPEGSVVNVRGLTTAQMTGEAAAYNMAGFDFENVWAVKENDYPVLKWQITEETGGNNGAVGATPQLRINEETNFWEVSYDNGETWTSLGVKATGENGADGTSIANIEKTNSENNVDTYTITLTDGSTYTFTVTNGVNGIDGANGADGQDGNDGADGVGIASAVINENGELVITLTDGSELNLGVVKGADGQNGTDGQNGADGADGRGIKKIELTSTVNNIDTYTITYTDGTVSTFTVTNGKNGENGQDAVGIRAAAINASGELVITLTDGTALNLGVVKGTDGQNGTNGQDGQDGVTPQLKIGDDNYWYVSYDNGETWTSLGVKATGENGADGQNGSDGADGVTPQLKIGDDNYWYVSYDNGETWTSLGIKATGETGADGANGSDGVGVESTEINDDGELIVTLTNGSVFNLGKVKGENGADGANGNDGADGQNGKDGADGKDGKDAATITSMYYNSKGELIIKMSDGTEINAGKPSNSAYDSNIKKPAVTISGYQKTRSVDYGTTITFHAKADYIPDGYELHWFVNGEDKGASDTLTVKDAANDFTVSARLMKGGSTISESKVEKVTVKNDFFSRIIAFFMKLFNLGEFVIDQK